MNPRQDEVLGERSYASLHDIDVPSTSWTSSGRSRAEDIARDAIAIRARTLWSQPGTHTDEAVTLAPEGRPRGRGQAVHRLHAWLARPGSSSPRVLGRLTSPIELRKRRAEEEAIPSPVQHRLQRGHQVLELGATHVGPGDARAGLDINGRRAAQQSPTLLSESRQGATSIALEDAPLHETPPLELVDGPRDAAGRERQP